MWPPPCVVPNIAGRVHIPNLSEGPHILKKIEYFCQINPVFSPTVHDLPPNLVESLPLHKLCPAPVSETKHSQSMILDPSNLLPPDIKSKFHALLDQYDSVFDPAITGYKAAFSPLQAKVNLVPVEGPS